MSHVLRRKLRRDMWRQRGPFAAVIVVIALGVAVYVGASDAYRNLGDSFSRAYSTQRLPDVVLGGAQAPALARQVTQLPGRPVAATRLQVDTGTRITDHTLLGRVISIPDRGQPDVARLVVRSGHLPASGEVLVEQHMADHFRLHPGSRIELFTSTGWRPVTVSGTGLSPEYFWPARSQQETMTTAEQFGVVFAPQSLVVQLSSQPQQQLALYALDRSRAGALVDAAGGLARRADLTITTRKEQPSYVALDQDVRTFGTFGTLLPVLFLAAAALGAFILLSRVVQAQRAVIGTLAANGIAPRTLRRHYLGFGLSAGALAAIPGILGGFALGAWFTTQYTKALGLPLRVVSFHPMTVVLAALAGILAAAIAAWVPARAAARTAPAEAMRIAPARSGHRSLLEHVLPVTRLPARWRMVLRGLSRNPRRAVFTIVGVAMSLTLVMVFAGLRDTVSTVVDRQYGVIDRSDGQLYANPGRASEVLAAAKQDPAVSAAEPFSRSEVTLTESGKRYDTLLLGLPSSTQMHRFIATNGAPLKLSDRGGVLLGVGLKNLLSVHVGDTVTITGATGDQLVEPVAGFVDEPMAAVAYVSLAHLTAGEGTNSASGALVQLKPGVDRAAASHRLSTLAGVAAYLDNAAVEETIKDAFAMMNVLLAVMLSFAVIMAFALLYNAMSANLAERAVELGTLNAAGLARRTLGRLVAAENLTLTVTGIPVGLAAGWFVADRFMASYENLGYRWSLHIQTTTILLVIAGILLASLLSQLPVVRGLRRIDIARIVRERAL